MHGGDHREQERMHGQVVECLRVSEAPNEIFRPLVCLHVDSRIEFSRSMDLIGAIPVVNELTYLFAVERLDFQDGHAGDWAGSISVGPGADQESISWKGRDLGL